MNPNDNPTPTPNPAPDSGPRQVEWSFDFGNVNESMKRLWAANVGTDQLRESHFAAPLAGTTRADLTIGFSVGRSIVRPLTDSDQLFMAHLRHVGDVQFEVTGETVKHVTLAQMGSVSFTEGVQALGHNEELRWQIGLSPHVPLNLAFTGGVGPVDMDLAALTITGLHVRCGVGTLALTMPPVDAAYTSKIEGGVGQFQVIALEGTSGKWEISAGVGNIEITVSPRTAIRLTAKTGIGAIHVPAHFHQLKGGDFFGDREWKTEGYELADQRLTIDYKGGIGQLRIMTAATV